MDKENRKESKAQKNQVEALTIKEAAELLGVPVNTLRRWIIELGLPHVFTFYEWFSKKCASFVIFTNSPGKVEGKEAKKWVKHTLKK